MHLGTLIFYNIKSVIKNTENFGTRVGNGMLPMSSGMLPMSSGMLSLMVMVCYRLGNLSKLPNRVCKRFRQPLMEIVSKRSMQPE